VNNKFLKVLVIFLFVSVLFAANLQSIFIKKIDIAGIQVKDIAPIHKIISPYLNRNLDMKQIGILKNKVSDYYKKTNRLFTKVILAPQTLKNGLLKFSLIRGKVGKITIVGNKYYSTNFIKRNFALKTGDFLDYSAFVKSLLLLSEYSGLKVKSLLKKGSKFATTDVVLKVKDKKPFHMSTSLDNLGSSDTSRYRLSANLSYGNLIKEGDEITLNTIIGTSSANTKLFRSDYALNLGKNKTKIDFGFLYANYVAAGDFSVLDMKGNTYVYTWGLTQPILRSFKNRLDASLTYKRKEFKNFLLGSLSSKDQINALNANLSWQRTGIFDTTSLDFSVSKGFSGDGSFGSRLNENINFLKYNLSSSYQRFINDKNSIRLIANGQYTSDKLPVAEMFSIGGLSSVRGFEPSIKLGDSGFLASIEWNYQPKINYKWLKDSLQFGLFLDHGVAFTNNPVPGEEKIARLTGAGFDINANIKKRYFANFTVGVPVYNSVSINDNRTHIYFVVGAKF